MHKIEIIWKKYGTLVVAHELGHLRVRMMNIAPASKTPIGITDLHFLQNWLKIKLGSPTFKIKGA